MFPTRWASNGASDRRKPLLMASAPWGHPDSLDICDYPLVDQCELILVIGVWDAFARWFSRGICFFIGLGKYRAVVESGTHCPSHSIWGIPHYCPRLHMVVDSPWSLFLLDWAVDQWIMVVFAIYET